MNIGIDIDDTLTNSSQVFIKYARIYNKINKINHIINTNELDQKKAFGWTKENQKEFAEKFLMRILLEATPNKNAVEIINKIKEEGHNIYFITARKDSEIANMFDFTRLWLEKNKIYYDKLIVNSSDKLIDCNENNIEIFIDDNYLTCKRIKDNTKIKVFMYETNYNSWVDKIEIDRVKNWEDIYRIILQIDKEKRA